MTRRSELGVSLAQPGEAGKIGGVTDPELVEIERAMVRLRRSMGRRTLGRALADRGVEFAVFGVVDAVEQGPDPSGDEVGVGQVGERLGIDPSRASRLVAQAVRAGYVRRVASQSDGRRIGLRLTDAGRELAESAHATRREYLAGFMSGWPADDRREFARLLTKFTADH